MQLLSHNYNFKAFKFDVMMHLVESAVPLYKCFHTLLPEILQNDSLLLPGFTEAAGAVFLLLLRALPAGAPTGPDPAGLPEGPGALVAQRGAEPHPQDGAGVWQAGRPGRTAAGGAGEESQPHEELGLCGKCDRC